MKIYRVVPNSFFEIDKLKNREFVGAEDIYYRMGYTSFLGRRGYHGYNNIYQSIEEEGKYFYLFFEDAVREGYDLVAHFHRLNTKDFFIVEYDVSEELLFKNIGVGAYKDGFTSRYIIETYVEKSVLGNEITNNLHVSKDQKLDDLVQFLSKDLKEKWNLGTFSNEEWNWYRDLFDVVLFEEKLNVLIDDLDRVRSSILGSSLDTLFLEQSGDLIKSPYITGRIIPINVEYIRKNFLNFNNTTEYFEQLGFQFDVSKTHSQFKDDLLYYLGKDSGEKDIEQVKLLLKERKYI